MRSVRFVMARGLCVLALAGGAAPALAQERPNAPDSLPSREQIQQPTPNARGGDGTQVRVDASGVAATAPCPLDTSPLRTTLTSVAFVAADGRALPGEISALLADVGVGASGEQPIGIVCRIRDRATAALRTAGYVASVQVPPQELSKGKIGLPNRGFRHHHGNIFYWD